MKNQINNAAKEIRSFVQTASSVGDKKNVEYIEKKISEVISDIAGRRKERIFSKGVIFGVVTGVALAIIVYLQWLL